MRLILGSESQGRKRILERLGYKFEVKPANIDEKAIRNPNPSALTLALALAKARALVPTIGKDAILITADQVVVYEGEIREKPTSSDQVQKYLADYSRGYGAICFLTVVVTNTSTGRDLSFTDTAAILFDPIPENVVWKYIKTGDPFLNAGGFDHEHPIIAPYVGRIVGSKNVIIGLLADETMRKLISDVSGG